MLFLPVGANSSKLEASCQLSRLRPRKATLDCTRLPLMQSRLSHVLEDRAARLLHGERRCSVTFVNTAVSSSLRQVRHFPCQSLQIWYATVFLVIKVKSRSPEGP
ncbi:hypothetical protein GN956_G23154 [Arapaima gigas]